ncbi:hypothetical protein EAI77_07855 [Ligilactobacillus ruminis]|nr:hypothetical protein EAI77_07855 [Ligilactobacillus ruminis]
MGIFVLLSEAQGPDLGAAVEHFFNFGDFCSTFGGARTGFGSSGRTFFQFLGILFYFGVRARRILSQR